MSRPLRLEDPTPSRVEYIGEDGETVEGRWIGGVWQDPNTLVLHANVWSIGDVFTAVWVPLRDVRVVDP